MPAAIDGGVTAPVGFRAAGVPCGIKPDEALDLAVIAAERTSAAAGLFTTNQVKAAPVIVSRDHLRRSGGRARAIVINSGCANACTGENGIRVARSIAEHAARQLNAPVDQVLVASTGVIGVALDDSKVNRGLEAALGRLSAAAHLDAARAIMTTDRSPKEAAVEVALGASKFRVGGIAKGAGMIEPHMATMLATVTTDVSIDPALLHRALSSACENTFNAISIDGDTSTNDTVFALASGGSGVTVGERDLDAFEEALTAVCRDLAIAIVRGGEGATRVVTICVAGTSSDAEARQVARTIGNSLLVKTAIHGADPNWGRILAAAGRAGVPFELSRVSVGIGPVVLFSDGRPHDERSADAGRFLARADVDVHVNLGGGPGAATIYTCDLSAEYVRINGEYRT
jgi:glutamate N-acetyltransferase/amino-acid N-acetyltransferase